MDADQLYDEVVEAAYWSLRRHNSGARTQMLTPADSIEWHVMRETQARMQPEIERMNAENEALRNLTDDLDDARTALEEMVGQLQAENEALRDALLELYRWCNVEIRGEGLHRGPIFFAGPVFGKRTEDDDHRFDALQSAEEALAAHDQGGDQ